jgi:hypothetical protein
MRLMASSEGGLQRMSLELRLRRVVAELIQLKW